MDNSEEVQLHTPKSTAQAWGKEDEPNWSQTAAARLSVLQVPPNSSFFPQQQGKHITKYQKVLETDLKNTPNKRPDPSALQLTFIWPVIEHTKKPYPPCVFHNFLIWLSIIWWIGIRIIAQLRQHGCNHGHVLQNISRYLPHPLWQGFHIDWLDDLVSRPFNPGEGERKVTLCIPNNTCFFTGIKTCSLFCLGCGLFFFSFLFFPF